MNNLHGFGNGLEELYDMIFNTPRNIGSSLTRFDQSYPRYNVVKTETGAIIEMALAGFSKDEIAITVSNGVLTVSGQRTNDDTREYASKCLTFKPFNRKFDLLPNVEVGKVSYIDGLLTIDLIHDTKTPTIQKINID